MLVSRAALVVVLAPYLVWAQLGALPPSSGVDNCECSPACEGGVGDGGCPGSKRMVAREDCPCCRVCAQEKGDPCSLPSQPCDNVYGFVCSPKGVCEAEFKCTVDDECPDDRFCLGNVCVEPCPILRPCQGALSGGVCVSRNHRPMCECPPGTLANSEANTCLPYNGTETGCQYEGRLYAVGEVRYTGKCHEQCRCGSDGTFSCGPVTCPPGLFLAGQHSQQELCIELRNRPETDECCVVVVCANSLARPSLLTSPVLSHPTPATEHEHQHQQVLRGRMVGPDPAPPITHDEYRQQLRDLQEELSKKNDKKKTTDVKVSDKPKPDGGDAAAALGDLEDSTVTTVVTEASSVTQEEDVTITPWDFEGSVQEAVDEVTEAEDFTTLMPATQEEEEQMREKDEAALVLEYDDAGDLVHRITVHEQVEVVTNPVTLEEETATDATPLSQQADTTLAREGKKAPEDANITRDEATVTESAKVEAKGGSGALKVVRVSHNSSTVVLPATKGGEVYYKSAEGTEWQRVEVEGGQDSLVLKGLLPNTQYTLKWSGVSGGSAKITIDTQEGCRVDNVSYPTGHEWSHGCQQRCSCRPAGAVDCQPRCLFTAGDIKDPQCTESPAPEDPECCVVYACKSGESGDITQSIALAAQESAGMPKLLVTEKTHNSVTLAWDDFRARTYEGGYVAEYREEPADPATGTMEKQPWMRKEVPTGELPPKLTVEGLKPNTVYEVRVSIYDDVEEGHLGEATETINVRTEAGCVHGNSSHPVGEFYNGCEERCMCVATGDVRCFERCTLPYFRAGSFRGDPLCSEQPDERDECCVIVRCASDRREAYNQCTNVVCGPNAECISGTMASKDLSLSDLESDLTLGYCRCLKGFTGDASDLVTGCVPDPSAGHKEGSCTFKNSTYRPGDVFYDECDYRCSCNNNSEIECEPRCEFPHEDGSETEPGCEYLPDPEDQCCKLRVCNSTSEAATDAARAPSLPSDGCTEGNITYARNEKFNNGCETSCICMGFGDVSCFPRCPPLKVVSETPKRCETLPDPLDNCCSITVCDEETPDVMKANITELEMEMMMTNMSKKEKEMKLKEIMMNMTEAEKEAVMKTVNENEGMSSDMDTMMTEEDMATTVMPEEEEMLIQLHSHSDLEETHIHKDGITHSHHHEHGMDEAHSHTLEDDQGHSHLHEHGINDEQANNSHDIFTGIHNHTHTHENGITHTHPHEHNMDNSHDHEHDIQEMHIHEHTHEVGTSHSHPQDHSVDHDHKHDTNDTHTHEHTHEDGTTHSHPHVHTVDHSHDHDTNETHTHEHTHEDGMTHSHPHDHTMDHSHDHDTNETHAHEHTHENGMTHSHPHDHTMDHSHDHDTNDTHTNEHTHEDGTTHSHPHDHTKDHSHDHDTNETHAHEHTTHEDDTTHGHPHDHTVNHDHDTDETHTHEHTHEDGTTHSHPHGHTMDHSLDHETNDTHTHEHTHEDGTIHSHLHEHGMDNTHNHEHSMNDTHSHTHMQKDGVFHNHPHEMNEDHNHTHVNSMDEGQDHIHTHEDGVTHSHPHEDDNHTHMQEDGLNDFHNQTNVNILEKKNRAEDLGTHDLNILEVMAVNATAVMIRLAVSDAVMNQILSSEDQHFMVLYSPDSLMWSEKSLSVSEAKIENFDEIVLYLNDLKPSTSYQFRVAFQDFVSLTSKATLMDGTAEADGIDGVDIDTSTMCSRNGRYYKPGQDFYEGCSNSCICTENLEVHCAAIECPVTFGLELIDPNCLEWDLDPDYVPTPPKCCAQVKCISTSACQYMGQTFNNYDKIPRELTGCSQVCTCNYGNVTCRDLCDPISTIPPPTLNCAPHDAVLVTLPGETCCKNWQCAAHSAGGIPVIFPLPPVSVLSGTHTSGFVPIAPPATPIVGADGIAEPHVTSLDARTVHLFFSTPTLYQGLPGQLVIRYTADPVSQSDPSTWSQEELVPMGTIISQSEWDHILTGLQPSTEYMIQIVFTVQDTEPITSPIITYTTMDEATTPSTTTPLPRLDINAELYASEITKTSAKVSWRGFNDFERQYIDGVQVKYTEKDNLIPKVSQLFHRDNDQMDLQGLLPGHSYTVDLVFITHENLTTQVSNTEPITFTTLPEEDPYAFEIEVTAGKVSSQTAELFYSGVPEPEEKYVNVYRAVYLRDDERVDAETFKVPKSGHERKIFLSELKPDVEYQVWLEAFLSNGRKKKSNVLTITTRAGELPKPERSEVDPSTKKSEDGEGYYSALVAVAIIAAIACLGFLGLLVILLRKQSHAKAHINSSRNNAAYDNPSYKVGDNTYDMEMNGIKGSGNGATHMEDP